MSGNNSMFVIGSNNVDNITWPYNVCECYLLVHSQITGVCVCVMELLLYWGYMFFLNKYLPSV